MTPAGSQPADLLPVASGVRRHEPQMTKQLKALQKENSRLKKLVAEQALDMEILKGMTSLSYLWLNGTR